MDTETLSGVLRDAGLSPYQADAYLAVLELGAASATTIADRSGVPAPRIYDVLASLEEFGYVETYEQESLRARAHDPTTLTDDLQSRADRLQSAVDEIEERWEQPELDGNTASIVRQFETVVDRARRFIQQAEYRVQLSSTPDAFERLRPALVEATERGVHVHVSIHTPQGEASPPVKRFEGACREARHRALPAPFVALVDRGKTCFTHHPDSYQQYGIVVNDRIHSYVFYWYFQTCLWEPWAQVYTAAADSFPREYIDVRYCVRDLQPLLDDGVELYAYVEGYDLETRERRELSGRVAEAMYVPSPPDGDLDAIPKLGGQVTILLETDEGTVQIGGWGSVVEDLEATRILVRVEDDRGPDQ